MTDIYNSNFELAKKLGIIEQDGAIRWKRSHSEPYMDLVIEPVPYLDNFVPGAKAFSIAHYFTQNGDLCKDPEMVILCHLELGAVQAFSFEMSIPPLYQEVYRDNKHIDLEMKSSLNLFLAEWLKNLVSQDHGQNWIAGEAAK